MIRFIGKPKLVKDFVNQGNSVLESFDEVENGFIAFGSRLNQDEALEIATALEEFYTLAGEEIGDNIICCCMLQLISHLTESRRAEKLHKVLLRTLASERLRSIDRNTKFSDSHTFYVRAAIQCTSLTFLTELLRDPGCVEYFKDAVLACLEELAYPDPVQSVVVTGLGADRFGSLAIVAMKIAADERRTQNRRFRTVSDAAKWVAEHHPEIDLDRPYHKHPPAK